MELSSHAQLLPGHVSEEEDDDEDEDEDEGGVHTL